MVALFFLAIDWSIYFGGWSVPALIASCVAGMAPLVAIVGLRLAVGVADDVILWVKRLI